MMAEHRDDLITGTAKPPDGMPHGTTVGNPTERIAFMLLCGHITQDISDIRKEIREMEEEYAEKTPRGRVCRSVAIRLGCKGKMDD